MSVIPEKTRYRLYNLPVSLKILLAFLPVCCGLAIISGFIYYRHEKKITIDSIENQAAFFCSRAEYEFNTLYAKPIEYELRSLAESPQLNNFLMSSREEKLLFRAELEKLFLTRIQHFSFHLSTTLLDETGQEIITVQGTTRKRNLKSLKELTENGAYGQNLNRLFVELSSNSPRQTAYSKLFYDGQNKLGFLVGIVKQEPEAGGFGGLIVQHYELTEYIDDMSKLTILENSVMWVRDSDGNILLSPAANEIKNTPWLDVSGKKHRDDSIVYMAEVRLAAQDSPFLTVTCSVPNEVISGELVPLLRSVMTVFSGLLFASVVASLLIARRISEPIRMLTDAATKVSEGNLRFELDPALTRPKDEVGILAAAFEKMTTNLQETLENLNRANEDLKHLTRIASHDLREPVRKISCFGQLLVSSMGENLNQDQKENLGFVIDGAEKMRRTVEATFNYAEIITNTAKLGSVDLEYVVTELREHELAELIRDVGSTICVLNPLPIVRCNPAHIRQLMHHLMRNALTYHKNGEPPHITISSRLQGDNLVRVEIEDNGIGIRNEDFERLFTPFKRLHLPQEYEGTGIGLAMCKKIVDRHGGDIGVSSTYGQGSTFWFTMPMAESSAAKTESDIEVTVKEKE